MRGIHVDVGGEGRYRGALNLNPGRWTTTTGAPGRAITDLIMGNAEALPLRSGSAHLITLENAPLRHGAAEEIARVLAPDGEVFLLHPASYAASAHLDVARAVGGDMHTAQRGSLTLARIVRRG